MNPEQKVKPLESHSYTLFTSWDISNQFNARHLWFCISGSVKIILDISVGSLNPDNIGLAIEIAFLSSLQADIKAIPS